MRNAFAAEITSLAVANDRIVLLSGDIGNRLFDTYKERQSERFMNCGVAEANMIGVAAGLAMCGFRPFVYTIAPFLTTRCLEQIRLDLCYHNLPVTLVGTGAGLSYASLGPTHHSLEDITFLRALPNMTVLCPADSMELRALLHATTAHDGPVYIRIGKKGEPDIHPTVPSLTIGQSLALREGRDVCLISTGNMLPVAMEVGDRLAVLGIPASVISHPCVKPLDEKALSRAFAGHRVVATIEEHSLVGGFGSAVAEWRTDRDLGGARHIRFGTTDWFPELIGNQQYLRQEMGIGIDAIMAKVIAALDTTAGMV